MPYLLNFAEFLSTRLSARQESIIHPHHPEERADHFHSIDPGAAELEVLNFLNALVYLFKPTTLLETGTGSGLTSLALSQAILTNGSGHLHTIEIDGGVSSQAKELIALIEPAVLLGVTFHVSDSLEWIGSYEGPHFDFVFFDSLLSLRAKELELLQARDLLASKATCVFHDTSRLRGSYYDDYNPDLIETLDRASEGRQWIECELSRGLRLIRFP